MSERSVVSKVAIADKLFEHEPTLVYWLIVNGSSMNHRGILSIYDGLSAEDTMIARVETYGACCPVFNPPIRCSRGLYITINDRIFYYTVGYLTEEVALHKQLPKEG